MTTSPPRAAWEAAGFTLEAAANCLDISPKHLRRLEREGFPFHQAERAERLFSAPITAFQRPRNSGGGSGQGKGRVSHTPAPVGAGKIRKVAA